MEDKKKESEKKWNSAYCGCEQTQKVSVVPFTLGTVPNIVERQTYSWKIAYGRGKKHCCVCMTSLMTKKIWLYTPGTTCHYSRAYARTEQQKSRGFLVHTQFAHSYATHARMNVSLNVGLVRRSGGETIWKQPLCRFVSFRVLSSDFEIFSALEFQSSHMCASFSSSYWFFCWVFFSMRWERLAFV